MPLIEKVDEQGNNSWLLRTTKGKIIYIKYSKGELSCRYDKENTGKMFYNHKIKLRAPTDITTLQMISMTRFKMDHSLYFPTKAQEVA